MYIVYVEKQAWHKKLYGIFSDTCDGFWILMGFCYCLLSIAKIGGIL